MQVDEYDRLERGVNDVESWTRLAKMLCREFQSTGAWWVKDMLIRDDDEQEDIVRGTNSTVGLDSEYIL